MCISATASFTVGFFLIAGGTLAVQKSYQIDTRYLPLALFPILIGVQQFIEGIVWISLEINEPNITRIAALSYLFFAYMLWPFWVPYMTMKLEYNDNKKQLFKNFSKAGIVIGLLLFMPHLWQPDWLNTQIINHSVAYQCTLITDSIFPNSIPYIVYFSIIALPPILSSYKDFRIFGAGLVISVPITNIFFIYANISVLCFFAAVMTFYIMNIIFKNKCEASSLFISENR